MIMRIGLDLAKNVFEVFGVDEKKQPVLRRTLKRNQVLSFFAQIGPCTVAFESCGNAVQKKRQKRPQRCRSYLRSGWASQYALCTGKNRRAASSADGSPCSQPDGWRAHFADQPN